MSDKSSNPVAIITGRGVGLLQLNCWHQKDGT